MKVLLTLEKYNQLEVDYIFQYTLCESVSELSAGVGQLHDQVRQHPGEQRLRVREGGERGGVWGRGVLLQPLHGELHQ